MSSAKIPVILDTDIGGDIDDTWALVMMLNAPELDIRMVVSDSGNTVYRARLLAKLLEIAGRTDIPVAVGIEQESDGPRERQAGWLGDYDLDRYPGTVHADGVRALVDCLRTSPDPVTLIAIGPVPNIAKALHLAPEIAPRTTFVGMHGSIDRQHQGKPGAIAEYNVVQDIPACQAVFTAPWKKMVITPLDTCGAVQLKGEKYAAVRDSRDPLAAALIDNYRVWRRSGGWMKTDPETESSILFDTVAVHLAYSTDFLRLETLGIRVRDDGFTVRDTGAPRMQVAMDWTDLPAYEDYLVDRLVQRVHA